MIAGCRYRQVRSLGAAEAACSRQHLEWSDLPGSAEPLCR